MSGLGDSGQQHLFTGCIWSNLRPSSTLSAALARIHLVAHTNKHLQPAPEVEERGLQEHQGPIQAKLTVMNGGNHNTSMEREALDTNTAPSATAPAPATVVGRAEATSCKEGSTYPLRRGPLRCNCLSATASANPIGGAVTTRAVGDLQGDEDLGGIAQDLLQTLTGERFSAKQGGARRAGVDQEPLGIDSSAAASLLSRIP
eukprot:CAMPEP_0198690026 /NCGR_PEP_ID=MMETSP1468-20131203/160868_1 /TAXON_ID=1461545 /ORGANISM="Mantoniella sp, Strain CCMP1436" /LENGTH=201 /DNA_ID=CAMNT_0044441811 /DNA_START=109 /DNA_END=713 /DNA_ORIENTATION=-